MEIQFQKNAIGYLRTILRQQQKQEQTQQIRLSDAMPDVGRVLGCWGQILIRSKEWRNASVGVTGGVMAWVLYQPEGEGESCCVDTWIPFQMKWDMEETERDGTMEVKTTLCHIDARMLSDRKLMVRANIGAQIHAAVSSDAVVYMPVEAPEDLQMLQQTYPVLLPTEAGEKQFNIEQQLEIPSDGARVSKLIRFSAQPTLTEYKIVADKLVLRGTAEVYVLYVDEYGKLHRHSWQIPFSQYTQLDAEYAPGEEVTICFELTQLEMEIIQPDVLELKLGFAAQYTISCEQSITIIEDMYSPIREVKITRGQLNIPTVLDNRKQNIRGEVAEPAGRIMDVSVNLGQPQSVRDGDAANTELEGVFQILYTDEEGALQCTTERWEKTVPATVSEDVDYETGLSLAQILETDAMVAADFTWEEKTVSMSPMNMIIGAEMGEAITPDPNRPSIILRRAGTDSLWEIARSAGSTVDAIRKANGLQHEPYDDQMLLIPIS